MTSQLQSWARALGGHLSGGQVLCPGPGHSAKDRSLSVKPGRDGDILVHSHTGDDAMTCKDFARSKLGLPAFKPNGHKARPPRPPPKPEGLDFTIGERITMDETISLDDWEDVRAMIERKRAGRGAHDDPPPHPRQANGEATPKHFELISFDKIAIDTTPVYLIKGIIPRVGLSVFWGPPKCGKSFLVFDLMMHVALGWKYRDRKVRQGAVVYCALEGCSAFKNRVEAFRRTHLPDNASEVSFHLMASPMSLVADHAALIASIRASLGTVLPVAIAIDTLNRSLAGSESDDRDMANYVKAADAIRDAFNCAANRRQTRRRGQYHRHG
jgi:AAA domain